jgi:hypothetical protein
VGDPETGRPDQLRDLDNRPLEVKEAADLAATFKVPDHIRA